MTAETAAADKADFFLSGPDDGPVLLLAHGAGAQATSPFMTLISELLAARDLATARFEFAYMAARRAGGKRRPPPRADKLIPEYHAAVATAAQQFAGRPFLIGGKSMGGRVASMCADELFAERRINGLVCLGYPFHPPGKPDAVRTAHLEQLTCPALIVQGERDPFGARDEIEGYTLAPAIGIVWATDGDHDLGPRGGKGVTRRGNLEMAADAIAEFARSVA